jgi:hypothetical protein
MVELPTEKTLLRGLVWGLAGALLGSLVFGLIASPLVLWEFSQTPLPYYKPIPDSPADLIGGYLQGGLVGILRGMEDLLSSFLFGSTVGFIFSAVPGALGGMILGTLIHFGVARLPFPGQTGASMAIGALIGGAVGLLLAGPMSLLPSPDSAMLIMGRLVPLVSLACGAWVGWRLISGCQRIKSPTGDERDILCSSSVSEELPILRPLLRGLGWGLIVCVLFNLVFSAVGSLLLKMDSSYGIMSLIISIVPAIVGGAIFSISLSSISRAPLPTPTKVLLLSIGAGGLGLLIAEPIVHVFTAFNYNQSVVFRLSQVTLGLLTAVVLRIWVGRQLDSD